MEKLKVYLAGDMFTNWREKLILNLKYKTLFRDEGKTLKHIDFLHPMIGAENPNVFMPRDLFLINRADIMLAYLTKGRIGTYIEMGIFYQQRKPIVTYLHNDVRLYPKEELAFVKTCSTAVTISIGEIYNILSFMTLG